MTAALTDDQAQQWRSEAQALLARARETHRPVEIVGHGSKGFYGQPVKPRETAETISTAGYHGIVAYDPSELVVVVRAGTPIEALEAVLAERGQRLAFEPPRFGGRGTAGGMVATGLSGPGRLSAGPCKDFILGLSVMNSDSTLLRFGGTVMKNVAGYDVSRLHTGAMGILGLILDVSIKVLPEPAARATVAMTCDMAESVSRCDHWLAEPLPISATAWASADDAAPEPPGLLRVRFSGAQAAVRSAVARFCTEYGATELDPSTSDTFWESLRDQRLEFFIPPVDESHRVLWRISVPAQTPVLPIAGPTLLEWGGALRWVWTDQPATEVRAAAQRVGGHATLYTAPEALREAHGAFAPLPAVVEAIHQRLKSELDPHHLFNPGRMYAGL
jgi:glycolate oxidase FAD binding subunit